MKNVISCSIRISVFTGAFHINNFHFCLTVEFDELYHIDHSAQLSEEFLSDVFDNVLQNFVAHW